jgi:hypothetical protein
MIDLCTATNDKYFANAILLARSYIDNLYNGNIYLYYFNIDKNKIAKSQTENPTIQFKSIPKTCNHAYEPNVFFYKTYAIKDCINNSGCFLYSDATNLFQNFTNITDYFIDDRLFLPYIHPLLINKYWTTQKCFYRMESEASEHSPQYWAGLQGYRNTTDNQHFINLMYEYMMDPEIALPGALTNRPDGKFSDCIQHRQDQSVFSILIDKLSNHQPYNEEKQKLFGDKQTFQLLDKNYSYNESDCCILSRKTKFLQL